MSGEERKSWRKNHPQPETLSDGSVNLMRWHCIPEKIADALEHLASIDLHELCNEAKIERCRATRDLSSCGRYVQHVLNSCGHASLCAECSQRCDVCPICRSPISNDGNRVHLRLYYKCIEAGLISKRRDERFQENEDNREYLVPDIQRLYSLFDVALENNLVSLICHYITDICMDESAVSSDPILAFLLDEVVVKDWCKQTFKNIINDLHQIYSNPMEAMSSQVHLFQKIAFQLTGISNVLEVMNSSFKGTLSVQLEELHHLLENVLKAKQHLDVMTWCARHQFLEDIQSRYPNFTLWTSHVHERKSAALKRSWPETLNNLEDPAPNGSSLFIEQALSNLGIEQSYEENSKEELDISCLLDRSSPRAFESLIDVADKNTEAGCYPFETLRTATDILFLHGSSDMVVAKQAIFLYYIFDRHWTRPEVEWRHLIDDFAASFGLSRHLVLESLVFYLLDDHTDLSLQESIRILPEISGPETHPKIAQVLLERQCPDVALTVLRCTGRDNFCTRVNSEHEGLKCVSLGEAVTAVRVKIECGLLTEAFLYQRMHCSELKEQIAKHGSSLETSNKKNCNSWMHEVELLVTEICYLCIRRNLVDRMIELPWDSDEEKYIHKCLFEHASQDPLSVFGSLLVVFYLQRYRYIEAYQVDTKLRNMEENVSDTANVDVVSRMTSITQWRTRLVDNGLKLLPEAQRVKVTSGDMADSNLSSSQCAPMPYDVEFSNVPPFLATSLTPFSNSNEHLQLNGKAPSVLEHKLLTLGTSTTRKNSAVDGSSFSNIWNGEQSSAVNIVTRDVSREDARQGLDSAVFSLPVRHRSGSRNMPLKEFNRSSSKVPFSDGPIQVGKTLYGVESLNFVGQTENSLPFMRGVASEDANDMMDTSQTNGESIRNEKLVIPIRQNQPDRPRSKVLSDGAKNINSSWSLGQSDSPGMKSGLRWRSDESSDDDLGPPPNRGGSVAKTRRPRFSRR